MTYTKMNDMNKRMFHKGILSVVLLGAMMIIFGMPAFAHAGTDDRGFADGKPLQDYTYTVEVYSGIEGTYEGEQRWSKQSEPGGEIDVTLDIKNVKVKNDKYYVRGFRLTGHDNDETDLSDDVTGFARATFTTLNQDVSYEVAYGIKGDMVEYHINYLDENGDKLYESDTYYGMPGDKPVVSYRYIDGYLPYAYTLSKRLQRDASENEFTFTYYDASGQTTTTTRTINQPAAPGTPGNPAGTAIPAAVGANAANAANAGNNATANIGDNNTPLAQGPQQYADLDDGDTPLAEPEGSGSHLPLLIGIGVGILLLIAIIAWLLARRRRAEEGAE